MSGDSRRGFLKKLASLVGLGWLPTVTEAKTCQTVGTFAEPQERNCGYSRYVSMKEFLVKTAGWTEEQAQHWISGGR